MPSLRRDAVHVLVGQVLIAALGADLTSVNCAGQWLTVGAGGSLLHPRRLPGISAFEGIN